MLIILPNIVADAINKRLDEQLARYPQFKEHRAEIYERLVGHFGETGQVPDFTLEPRAETRAASEEKR